MKKSSGWQTKTTRTMNTIALYRWWMCGWITSGWRIWDGHSSASQMRKGVRVLRWHHVCDGQNGLPFCVIVLSKVIFCAKVMLLKLKDCRISTFLRLCRRLAPVGREGKATSVGVGARLKFTFSIGERWRRLGREGKATSVGLSKIAQTLATSGAFAASGAGWEGKATPSFSSGVWRQVPCYAAVWRLWEGKATPSFSSGVWDQVPCYAASGACGKGRQRLCRVAFSVRPPITCSRDQFWSREQVNCGQPVPVAQIFKI